MNERHFDKTEAFKSEVEPLLEQLRQKLREHKLPYILNICYGFGENGYSVCHAAGLTGEKTPDQYYVADIVLEGRANEIAVNMVVATARKK